MPGGHDGGLTSNTATGGGSRGGPNDYMVFNLDDGRFGNLQVTAAAPVAGRCIDLDPAPCHNGFHRRFRRNHGYRGATNR